MRAADLFAAAVVAVVRLRPAVLRAAVFDAACLRPAVFLRAELVRVADLRAVLRDRAAGLAAPDRVAVFRALLPAAFRFAITFSFPEPSVTLTVSDK